MCSIISPMLAIVISSLLTAAGVALQFLVPLHIIDVRAFDPVGHVPPEIFAIFIGLVMIVLGICGLYLFHYKAVAEKLDARFMSKPKFEGYMRVRRVRAVLYEETASDDEGERK